MTEHFSCGVRADFICPVQLTTNSSKSLVGFRIDTVGFDQAYLWVLFGVGLGQAIVVGLLRAVLRDGGELAWNRASMEGLGPPWMQREESRGVRAVCAVIVCWLLATAAPRHSWGP